MSKNLIPEIAKMLGVELGEEFKVKGDDALTYRFDSDGLKLTHNSGIEIAKISANVAFAALVNGKDEIVTLQWKPKPGNTFYSFEIVYRMWVVCSYTWLNSPRDYALLGKGWVYRSEEEAQAALHKVAAELGVEYEI